MTPAEWFALIEEHALALRARGVTEISLEGVTIRLAPAPIAAPPPASGAKPPAVDDHADPLEAIPGYTLDPEPEGSRK